MMRATGGFLILALLLTGAACAAAASASADPAAGSLRVRYSLITLEELQLHGRFSNLYDVIANLRPRWLRAQGPDSLIGRHGQVQVHMDGNRLGGVDVLRSLAVPGVTSIQWVAPIDAGARFGINNSHGAIIISTRPVH